MLIDFGLIGDAIVMACETGGELMWLGRVLYRTTVGPRMIPSRRMRTVVNAGSWQETSPRREPELAIERLRYREQTR